jgi:hypothetical protein
VVGADVDRDLRFDAKVDNREELLSDFSAESRSLPPHGGAGTEWQSLVFTVGLEHLLFRRARTSTDGVVRGTGDAVELIGGAL